MMFQMKHNQGGPMHVGTVLKIAAAVKGQSVAEIHRKSGVSRQQIFDIFAGNSDPTTETLKSIAAPMGLSASKVLELAQI